jgi:exonuclease VII small subunit
VLHQLASVYRNEQLIANALTKATTEAEKRRPELEQRLASITAEITRAEHALERYYEAFEQGTLTAQRCERRLTRLQARLDDSAPNKPNSPSKRHKSPHARPHPPISPTSPTTSNTSSPKPNHNEPKRCYGC